jgi:phosphatidylglycerol:prolipoprotein diacylglycerol transferase
MVIRIVTAHRRGQSVAELLCREGLIWAIVAAAIVLVLPIVELTNLDGEPIGLAIRGYGVMLVIAVASAVGLAAYRAKQRGIDPEVIFSMAPWAFIGGIVGARLFFVIQYRDQFIGETIGETLASVFKFTEGGLVVYGSFLGGFIAGTYYIIRHRLSWLKFGDVIVPCIFLGVFFGRIGCLMNGCCYGGRCEDQWSALHFPPTSPVYQDQLRSGDLIGFTFDPETRRIESIREGSLAESAGIQVGSKLEVFADDFTPLEAASRKIPKEDARTGVIATIDGKRYRWSPDQLPDRALPVHAAQLLSSVSSLVLCLLLCGLSVFKYREGTVMMLGFAAYAVVRFVLEWVRVDELGQFGTDLSISQWVSMVVFSFSILGLWWIYRTPQTATMQPQASSGT